MVRLMGSGYFMIVLRVHTMQENSLFLCFSICSGVTKGLNMGQILLNFHYFSIFEWPIKELYIRKILQKFGCLTCLIGPIYV